MPKPPRAQTTAITLINPVIAQADPCLTSKSDCLRIPSNRVRDDAKPWVIEWKALDFGVKVRVIAKGKRASL